MHTVTHKSLITYSSSDVSIASGPKLRACVLADIKAPFIFFHRYVQISCKKERESMAYCAFSPIALM